MDLTALCDLDRFLATVKIETDGDPKPWSEVADDWQKDAIAGIAPAFVRLVNPDAPEPTRRKGMWIRPRGHAKTADAALLVAYVLAFSARRRRAVWVAADKDQGCEGLDALETIIRHNPWLARLLTVRSDSVHNLHTDSVVYFSTSDVSSAFGWKDVDLFILDELTHWRQHGADLWDAMFSSAGKRREAIFCALMNAGWNETWQRRIRDTVADDPEWSFSELPDAVASWIDRDRLRSQNRYVSETAFNRLWRNQWVDGAEGDALEPALVRRAFSQHLFPRTAPEPGFSYCAGLDIGISRNASSFVVVGVRRGHDDHALYRVVHCKAWHPPAGGRVDLAAIERHILEQHQRFSLADVRFDPFQAQFLASRLQSGDAAVMARHLGRLHSPVERIKMSEVTFTPRNLMEMATVLIESLSDGRLESFVEPDLMNDLLKVRVEERVNGSRLVFATDASRSHGDRGTALVLALLGAKELAAKRQLSVGTTNSVRPGECEPTSAMDRHLAMLRERDEYLRSVHAGLATYPHTESQEEFMRMLRQASPQGWRDLQRRRMGG